MIILAPEDHHYDDRRKLVQLLTADIKQINVYQAKKNAILGEHFHVETTEYFYIVKGLVNYNKLKILPQGTLFMVNPGETHRLKCLMDTTLMTFLSRPYTKESPDIFKEKK